MTCKPAWSLTSISGSGPSDRSRSAARAVRIGYMIAMRGAEFGSLQSDDTRPQDSRADSRSEPAALRRNRHREERSDAAIQEPQGTLRSSGLLCFARNYVAGSTQMPCSLSKFVLD